MELIREYKRDIYSNYMYIKALQKERFEAKMLMENDVTGIVSMQTRNVDGEEYYYYDISSKQPIANLFERGQLKYEQIKAIFNGIITVVENGRKYLLCEDDFILDTEYIFITLSNFNVSLCYFPGYSTDISKQFVSMIEYIMDKADHTDEKAVLLVYSLYKAARQECTLANITDIINREVQVPDKSIIESQEFSIQQEDTISQIEEELELEEEQDDKNILVPVIAGSIVVLFVKIILGLNWIISIGVGGGSLSLILFGLYMLKSKEKIKEVNEEKSELFNAGYEFSQYVSEENDVSEDYEAETVLLADYRVTHHFLIPVADTEGENVAINEYPFVIGKLKDKVDYVINDDTISRIHAKIQMADNNQLLLVDLNSKNGSFVNGERLLANETRKINSGDKIAFADFEFIIK